MKPMPRRILPVRLLLLASTVSFSVACGAISTLTGSSSPSAGAIIRGVVQGGSSAGTAATTSDSSGAGIRVSVVGTSLATTADSSGQFVLQNVPEGTVRLRFQGDGVDATLEISGLASGQTLTITVQASGSRAVVSSEREVEFTGDIQAVTPPTLRVSGLTVMTTAQTEVERGDSSVPLSSLRVGETVKVEGILQADGSVVAREVKAQGPGPSPTPTPSPRPTPTPTPTPNPGRETELTGTVQSVTPPTLRVSGTTVMTNANTEIKRGDARIALSSIQVGETVEVEGTLQADGTLLAREIKAQRAGPSPSPTPSPDPGARVEFSGTIQSITPPSLRVSGRTVVTHSGTEFKGEGRTHSLADFKVGDRVEVEGRSQPDGSVRADEIKRVGRDDDDD
jgi:uncharacterized protein DUF5666